MRSKHEKTEKLRKNRTKVGNLIKTSKSSICAKFQVNK